MEVLVSNADDFFTRTETTILENRGDTFMYLLMGHLHVMGNLHGA